MSTGRSLETADNTQVVNDSNGYRYQSEAESNRVFMAFLATEDSTGDGKSPAFQATVYLRSFAINQQENSSVDDSNQTTGEDGQDGSIEVKEEIKTVTEKELTTLEEYLAANKEKNGPIIIT